MVSAHWLPAIWLAMSLSTVSAVYTLANENGPPEAVPRTMMQKPPAPTPTPTSIPRPTPSKGKTSSSKGMSPLLASALADLMAKNGDSPEAGVLGAVLGGGRPNKGISPMMAAPMAFDAARGKHQIGLPFPTFNPRPPPGALIATIDAVSGKGEASVYSCWQSHIDYNQMTLSYSQASGKTVWETKTLPSSTMETIYHNTSVPTSTFCDGYARILGETATPVTLTFHDASMITQKQVFPGPTPACKVQDYQCKEAYSVFERSSFSFISSAYFSYFLDSEPRKKLPNIWMEHVKPPCTSIEACPAPSESATCTLDAERATIFYWPSSTAGDFCTRGSFPTPTEAAVNPASPSTAVYGKVTVTSPSALVLVRTVAASFHPKVTVSPIPEYLPFTRCGSRVNATLKLAPSVISSLRSAFTPTYIDAGHYTGYKTSSIAYPFNFADMNSGAVPWDAYVAPLGCNMQSKDEHQCPSTILPTYTPILSLPNDAKQVGYEGEFENCAPGRIQAATYLPITAEKLELPSKTYYGARVTVGPKFSAIKPEAQARFVMADATVTAEVVPGTDD